MYADFINWNGRNFQQKSLKFESFVEMIDIRFRDMFKNFVTVWKSNWINENWSHNVQLCQKHKTRNLIVFYLFRGLDRVCGNFVPEAKGAKGAEKRGRDSSQFRQDIITLIHVMISELQNVTDFIHVTKMRIEK